ncbi:Protein-S-isoprenylcysteine O-methyltransferase [Mycena indigotica]|uniref:Protein-S-isoprenylcysteine O-methyltransferase n=1 Tax=Mycena indigotica TaxID=2126181 RepID=A0A8H6TDC7_9AGAR|nr:Protein-S-isoprenylcysteine O-methyltransferase [Mycena indigotica]KAF7315351.1 Protein-S-isoprenylcysteine O-methyltransferase [Mycena indigotica]
MFKIPFLVSLCLSLQIAITPPNPPPQPNEHLLVSTPFESLLKQRLGPIIVKCLCWIVAFVESAVIIAQNLPDWRYSAHIVSAFSFNGRSNPTIRISPLFVFGIYLTLLGAALRAWCYRELGI